MPPALANSDDAGEPRPHDPYAALREPGFRRYWIGNIIAMLGVQMQIVAVEFEVYARTESNLDVGLVALAQFLPVLLWGLPAGQLADRFDRKRIIRLAMAALTLGSVGLAWVSWTQADIRLIYVCVFLNGTARVLQQPAKQSMLPLIVPREHFSNAVTWSSSGFQLACILGPAAAGALVAALHSFALIYLLEALATFTFLVLLTGVHPRAQQHAPEAVSWKALAAGIHFVWSNKIILGAMSLDLFAVLFGGATTLLPAYAKDILDVGASGVGWLRAAPAVGAICMSLYLAHRRPLDRAGQALLWSVAGFGVATIIFGVSRSFGLSLFALFLTGALDMISVVIRHSLVQLLTPDEMRGRVSAVNGFFIGASNELGGFESGVVAHAFRRPLDPSFGPTVSVVSGGFGTLFVVGLIAAAWPQLRQYGRIGEHPVAEETPQPATSA
jgi:MFS family permease